MNVCLGICAARKICPRWEAFPNKTYPKDTDEKNFKDLVHFRKLCKLKVASEIM